MTLIELLAVVVGVGALIHLAHLLLDAYRIIGPPPTFLQLFTDLRNAKNWSDGAAAVAGIIWKVIRPIGPISILSTLASGIVIIVLEGLGNNWVDDAKVMMEEIPEFIRRLRQAFADGE